jgi:hypothetical protein
MPDADARRRRRGALRGRRRQGFGRREHFTERGGFQQTANYLVSVNHSSHLLFNAGNCPQGDPNSIPYFHIFFAF